MRDPHNRGKVVRRLVALWRAFVDNRYGLTVADVRDITGTNMRNAYRWIRHFEEGGVELERSRVGGTTKYRLKYRREFIA